jgi:tetratricopeptide (TPR) repeat protein
MAGQKTFIKCVIFLLFQSMVSAATTQPSEHDYNELRLHRVTPLIATYPDSLMLIQEKNLLELRLADFEKILRKHEKSTLQYLVQLIEGTATDQNFTVEEAQHTLANYYFEHKEYARARDTYLQALSYQPDSLNVKRTLVTKVLVEAQQNNALYEQNSLRYDDFLELATALVFTESAYGKFHNSQTLSGYKDWKLQHYRLITKASTIAMKRMNNGDVILMRSLLESVKGYIYRNASNNTYDFEQYASLYSTLAMSYLQKGHRVESLFLEHLYLLTGSPVGQHPEVPEAARKRFREIQNKTETWCFIEAINELRKAYCASYDRFTTSQKQEYITTARKAIQTLGRVKEITPEKKHVLAYLKTIIAFEFDGETNDSYAHMNNSLGLNNHDFYVFEYKRLVLSTWTDSPNYTCKNTDIAKQQRLIENALAQSTQANLATIKKFAINSYYRVAGT